MKPRLQVRVRAQVLRQVRVRRQVRVLALLPQVWGKRGRAEPRPWVFQ